MFKEPRAEIQKEPLALPIFSLWAPGDCMRGLRCRPVDAPTLESLLGPQSWQIATLLLPLELIKKELGEKAAEALGLLCGQRIQA